MNCNLLKEVSPARKGRRFQAWSSFHCVSSSGGRHDSMQHRAADASVCAVMWSNHASVLGKYATFHLGDAGRCKAAAGLPSSLGEKGAPACAKLQTSALEELLLWFPVLCTWRDLGPKGSEWVLSYDPGEPRWVLIDVLLESVTRALAPWSSFLHDQQKQSTCHCVTQSCNAQHFMCLFCLLYNWVNQCLVPPQDIVFATEMIYLCLI